MFESEARLREDVIGLLATIREAAEARYACVVERSGVRFEIAEPTEATWPSRQFLEARLAKLFSIPQALADDVPIEDVFAEWESLAGSGGRVPSRVRQRQGRPRRGLPGSRETARRARKPLEVLADRLLRLNSAWRVDEKGRGLFFGRPRLDLVVIGGQGRLSAIPRGRADPASRVRMECSPPLPA